MTYTVVWLPAAMNHLATIWLSAPDRAAVTSAANIIDAKPRVDPYGNSKPHPGSARAMAVSPLVVTFDVSDPDCLVTVWAVWRKP